MKIAQSVLIVCSAIVFAAPMAAEVLNAGTEISKPSGDIRVLVADDYELRFGSDGNVGLFHCQNGGDDGNCVWTFSTGGIGEQLVLDPYGNFYVRDRNGTAIAVFRLNFDRLSPVKWCNKSGQRSAAVPDVEFPSKCCC